MKESLVFIYIGLMLYRICSIRTGFLATSYSQFDYLYLQIKNFLLETLQCMLLLFQQERCVYQIFCVIV